MAKLELPENERIQKEQRLGAIKLVEKLYAKIRKYEARETSLNKKLTEWKEDYMALDKFALDLEEQFNKLDKRDEKFVDDLESVVLNFIQTKEADYPVERYRAMRGIATLKLKGVIEGMKSGNV
jgi:hypothetical protein